MEKAHAQQYPSSSLILLILCLSVKFTVIIIFIKTDHSTLENTEVGLPEPNQSQMCGGGLGEAMVPKKVCQLRSEGTCVQSARHTDEVFE